MNTITNYKLKDFLKKDDDLINDYVSVLNLVKWEDTTTKRPLINLKVKHIESIKEIFSKEFQDDEDLIFCIKKVQKLSEKEVFNLEIKEFFRLKYSIQIQLEDLLLLESNALTNQNTDAKFLAVDGASRLEKFGIYNTLDALAKGDILKYKEILNLSYNLVFTKLLLDKTTNDIQHDMNNIKTTKHN